MIKIKIVLVLLLLIGLDTAKGIEIRGEVSFLEGSYPINYSVTNWDATNFAGFWYDQDNNLKTEILKIIRFKDARSIERNDLNYITSRVLKRYYVSEIKGKYIKYGLDKNGNVAYNGTHYAIVVWQGKRYVAIKGSATNISRLILEQSEKDKKILKINETWNIGDGYSLHLKSIDQSTKKARLILRNNETLLLDNVLVQNQILLYNPNNMPIFLTYLDNVSSTITLKYTWVISKNILNIKNGNIHDKMMVYSVNKTSIILKNFESMSLMRNRTIDIIGDLKFKVANSNDNDVRFYPMILSSEIYDIRGKVFNDSINERNTIWDAINFPGFWYDINDNKQTERLTIFDNINSKDRIIDTHKLEYMTSRAIKRYKLNSYTGKYVKYGLSANGNVVYNGTHYAIVAWQGKEYIALNGINNKFTKLILEQPEGDYKTLKLNEVWRLGEGYELKLLAIDTNSVPRKILLNFIKNGSILEEKILREGEVFTHNSYIAGMENVPVFVTYLDSIFSSTCSESFIRLKYTWVISQYFVEIKVGNKFGNMIVDLEQPLTLYNYANMSLNRDGNITIMNNMRFKVANSSILRFYPLISYS